MDILKHYIFRVRERERESKFVIIKKILIISKTDVRTKKKEEKELITQQQKQNKMIRSRSQDYILMTCLCYDSLFCFSF